MLFSDDFLALLSSGMNECREGVDVFSDEGRKMILGHQTPTESEKTYRINNDEYILVRDWILPVYDKNSLRAGNCAKTRFRKIRKGEEIDIFRAIGVEEPDNALIKHIKNIYLRINHLENYRRSHPTEEACFLAVKPLLESRQCRNGKYYMVPFEEHEMVFEESVWGLENHNGVSVVPKLKISADELPRYPTIEMKSRTSYLW